MISAPTELSHGVHTSLPWSVVETAGIIAHSYYLAGSDDVYVARLNPPLPISQPHRAAASLKIGEHEEVVGVRVPGRFARGELPTEPYGTRRNFCARTHPSTGCYQP